MISQGEPEQQHKNNNNPFSSSLGRQSSIYSLTLDEFQHTLCESGKNFGSMNMDEFLTSIWTAEENQATTTTTATTNNNNHALLGPHAEKGIAKQPSLPRQGSLTLPAPLCRKTVEEVWSEIHGDSTDNNGDNNVQKPESAPRQPTFGEMTLEDFLIRAGVVREQSAIILPASQPQPQHQQYGVYQNSNPTVGPTFVNRPMIGLSGAGGGGGGPIAESSGYAGNGKRSTGGYPPQKQQQPPLGVCYGGRVMNGGGGYGAGPPAMGVVAPVSPVSSDGMCTSTQVDNSASQFDLDMGGLRGRKRIIDGPVEKVVERRQRRMIKNRESAARSRARKQVINLTSFTYRYRSSQNFPYNFSDVCDVLIATCLF